MLDEEGPLVLIKGPVGQVISKAGMDLGKDIMAQENTKLSPVN